MQPPQRSQQRAMPAAPAPPPASHTAARETVQACRQCFAEAPCLRRYGRCAPASFARAHTRKYGGLTLRDTGWSNSLDRLRKEGMRARRYLIAAPRTSRSGPPYRPLTHSPPPNQYLVRTPPPSPPPPTGRSRFPFTVSRIRKQYKRAPHSTPAPSD